MKKYIKYITSISFAIGLIISCDDIVEENISDDSIVPIAPLNRTEHQVDSIQFRWNSIEGADEYRLQVNNEATTAIILDTLVVNTIFDYKINPGTYSWRVRAENFAYVSPYSFSNQFVITSSDDLSEQKVNLVSPSNNQQLNDVSQLIFTWDELSIATAYNIRISEVTTSGETVVFDNDGKAINENSITITDTELASDGEYKWAVQAINDDSSTIFFSRTFFVDTQKPVVPSLLEPITDQTVDKEQPILFKWSFTSEDMEMISSTIQIAKDEGFTDVEDTISDVPTEVEYIFEAAGTFFWRVRGIDIAGNVGEYSEPRQVIVN